MSLEKGDSSNIRIVPVLFSTATPRSRTSLIKILTTFFGLTIAYVIYVYNALSPFPGRPVPPYASRILAECDALVALPGPPPGFVNRPTSDRYDTGTPPTLITNATIWTGGKDGHEVFHNGDVLLDRGLIKFVGQEAPKALLKTLANSLRVVNAREAWVTPAIVDLHNHAGVESLPGLSGSSDGNSELGITQPWLRSVDAIDTHDRAFEISRAGGVGTALILPGSANAIGGQAFVIKTRSTKEGSSISMVLEPPYTLVNSTESTASSYPRWRHIKHAAGENPSRVYDGTRMDTLWKFREAYTEGKKLKDRQDEYCAKAKAGQWTGLASEIPTDLKWEALADVLRGRVKVNVHLYETVDISGIVGLSNEFKFPIAAFHHAHEAYLVPDAIKRAYGKTPGVAIFSTFARYKKEAFRGSEYAARILHDNGIRVVMKSDAPFPVNSRYLLHEAAQAHYYGLPPIEALKSVTTTPADISGLNYRIGYLQRGWDADVVVWDSHPLSLGATPKQLWIDGIAQYSEPHVVLKPSSHQDAPHTPNFDNEAKDTLKYDGLPPLAPKDRLHHDIVVFVNVKDFWTKSSEGDVKVGFTSASSAGSERLGVVIASAGKIICSGSSSSNCATFLKADSARIVDLKGGSVSPGLTTIGAPLGLGEIEYEASTSDGSAYDPLASEYRTSLLKDVESRASDGLIFGTRDALLAYRGGVTSAISAPRSEGFFVGVSTAFSPGAANKLDKGALLSDAVALHVAIDHYSTSSISSQIALIRRGLYGEFKGERGIWFAGVANGEIPLAITVDKADHISSIISVKREIEATSGIFLRIILLGAAEAHLVADYIAEAGINVVLIPTRPVPLTWDTNRLLLGPPLAPESALEVLLRAAKSSAALARPRSQRTHVAVGVKGAVGSWPARNTRFDIGWVSLASNGSISKETALELVSTELEKMFGLKSAFDLVAYEGGDFTEYESKAVGVISPGAGYVDLF